MCDRCHSGISDFFWDELDGILQSEVIWEPYDILIRGRLSNICLAGEAA